MRIPVIRAVFRKELRFMLRDKKAIFAMIAVPLLLFPAIFIVMMLIISSLETTDTEDTYDIAVWQLEAPVQTLLEDAGVDFVLRDTADYAAAVSDGTADAALVYRDGGYTIIYNAASIRSDKTADLLQEEIDAYADTLTEEMLVSAGLDPEESLNPLHLQTEDLSTGEETMGSLLGMIVPLMLLIGVFYGAQTLAVDTTAGEKERNTQETLMTLPISGRELICGKFLTVALFGMMSALLYMISLLFIGGFLASSLSSLGAELNLDILSFGPAILVVILAVMAFALLLSAVLMCICSFAKSTKEAAGYMSPLMIVIMMVSYSGMVDIHLTTTLSAVPVLNIVLLIKSVLTFEYNILAIVLVLVSNVAYAAIAIAILGRLYTSERILFGEKEGSLLERRSQRTPGATPSLGDGILVFLVTLLLYLYLGIIAANALGAIAAVVIGLLIVGGVCTAAAWYGRVDLRASFSLRLPKHRAWPAAALLGIGGFFLFNGLLSPVSSLLPDSAEAYTESFEILLDGMPFPALLLVIAVLPAVCEEALFRGYLLSALPGQGKRRWLSAVLSAALFGLYHMNLFQGIYAFLLGLLLAWVLYRTGSILCTVLMHLLANGLALVLSEYGEVLAERLPVLLGDTWTSAALWMGIGAVLTASGAWLLLRKNKKAGKVS